MSSISELLGMLKDDGGNHEKNASAELEGKLDAVLDRVFGATGEPSSQDDEVERHAETLEKMASEVELTGRQLEKVATVKEQLFAGDDVRAKLFEKLARRVLVGGFNDVEADDPDAADE